MKNLFKLFPLLLSIGLLASCGEAEPVDPTPGPDQLRLVKYDFSDLSQYGITNGGYEISHNNNKDAFTAKIKENAIGENAVVSMDYSKVYAQKVGIKQESGSIEERMFLTLGTSSSDGSIQFNTAEKIQKVKVEATSYRKAYSYDGGSGQTIDTPLVTYTVGTEVYNSKVDDSATEVGYSTRVFEFNASANALSFNIEATNGRLFLLSVTLYI